MTFKELRKNAGYSTQETLANKLRKPLSVTRSAIAKWESGLVSPRVEQVPAIASALNVPIVEVVEALLRTRKDRQRMRRRVG